MKLARLAAWLLVLIPFLPPQPALASCLRTRPIRVFEARVSACRKADDDLRQALESFRTDYDTWLQIPQRLPSGRVYPARPYDELVEQRVRRVRGVIVRLEPTRYRELSEPPAPGRQPSASTWTPVAEVKGREYYLRLEQPDCDAVHRATAFFIEADDCCDTVPPSDDACLLKLPAVKPLPDYLAGLEADN
jgi:hypothetical protein